MWHWKSESSMFYLHDFGVPSRSDTMMIPCTVLNIAIKNISSNLSLKISKQTYLAFSASWLIDTTVILLGWRWFSIEMSQFGYSAAKCRSQISHPVANVFCIFPQCVKKIGVQIMPGAGKFGQLIFINGHVVQRLTSCSLFALSEGKVHSNFFFTH